MVTTTIFKIFFNRRLDDFVTASKFIQKSLHSIVVTTKKKPIQKSRFVNPIGPSFSRYVRLRCRVLSVLVGQFDLALIEISPREQHVVWVLY